MGVRPRAVLATAVVWAITLALAPALAAQVPDDGEPQLAGSADRPELKYAVVHGHHVGWCYGYLYVSREGVRYEVSEPESDKAHAFTLSRSEIQSAGAWRGPFGMGPPNWSSFKPRKGGQISFKHVHAQNVETGQLAGGQDLPYTDLVEGYNSFETVLERVRGREARLHPPPPKPPVVSLTEPAGTEAGQSVDALGPTLRVRGVAAQANGVNAVTVNGEPASMKTLTPQTVEFDVRLLLNPGANRIQVRATAADGTKSELAFQAVRPEVRVLEPAAGLETQDATVRVRGLAIGFRGVEKAEVAGSVATLAQRDDGVEFSVEGVQLALGANQLKGYVIGANGAREEFRVGVRRVPPPPPPALTLAEVEKALQDGLSKAKVSELVTRFGVDFALTNESERRLRAVGADSDLLLLIAKSKK